VWRRLLLVPFSVVIPPAERDPHLAEKLRGEYPGILAWMVGAVSDELPIPASIRLATVSYRGQSNTFEDFLESECDFAIDTVTLSTDIVDAYAAWAAEEGLAVHKGKAIGPPLRARGCVTTKLDGARAWRGVSVRSGGHIARNQDECPDTSQEKK